MQQLSYQARDLTYQQAMLRYFAKAKVLPSGEGFKVGTSDITLRQWDAVPTNASQTWTAIP